MLIMIDNYDSFTYNIYQVIASAGHEVKVIRNDELSLSELQALKPSHLLISPGPGTPNDAGISLEAIGHFAGRIPVFGVCLGHQSLAQAFGGKIVRAGRIMHGKTSPIQHKGTHTFKGLPQNFDATRYHSLIVDRPSLPKDFEIIAETAEHEIMGIYHRPTGAQSVQFHPESILSPQGPLLLENFAQC